MSEPTSKSYLPDDIEKAIKDTKQLWRARIGDVPALLENIVAGLERDIQAIEQDMQNGNTGWPEANYEDIAAGTVSADVMARVKQRGCLVVRGHFPREQA